ncbi:glycoside hydrolase family 18 protein [Suillus subalutaceus]|uniref:glycoside hydrolase family 18 protein n=1 Tax=Suillus subalutaceus TaxID=48586 RepID=UPI001B8671A6|nr:glycoside hydrolase family 18 protein [Suillus subalutaceus]KAG1866495.1 glycoside hydrolase family 18 protein [Suillus subalutaceus]
MTYFVDWAPPTNMNFALFDCIDFAFALPNAEFKLVFDSPDAPTLLRKLVTDAHAAAKLVKLSIGGWTGSHYFSQAVSTPANRDTFVNNILASYKEYNLDGIDIDWEYPGQPGRQGNTESPSDEENMLEFLRLLRLKLPPGAKISAAVQNTPFAGSDGQPIKDASGFAEIIDWILMMNYDDFQAANPPGPNAPLYDGCGNSTQPSQNAAAGYNAWTSAGFPANKLVLGIPAYGYVSGIGVNHLRQRRSPEAPRLHRLARRTTINSDDDHQIQFRDLVTKGVLQRNNDGTYAALPSSGFQRSWDQCSATPFLHSDTQTIPYDDPESLAMKGAFAKKTGMLGVNMFDVHGDTDQWDLITATRNALLGAPSTPVSGPASALTSSSGSPSAPLMPGGDQQALGGPLA